MEIGVSTACFYPMETMQAFSVLQQSGIKTTEIFLNTFSELKPEYLQHIKNVIAQGNTKPVAIHPFTSGMETFFFASLYAMRIEDGIALYKQYFEFCKELNIPRVVFHGDYTQTPFSFAKHCGNFARLRDVGRDYGVELCQENVVRCKCGTPRYITKMREILHDDVSFVLDVKQLRRSKVSLDEMLNAMKGKISHVHLSDETQICDCAAPGTGSFDFEYLFRNLIQNQFNGDMVIELYRGDFKDITQLEKSVKLMNELYAKSIKKEQ